ncbi:response regulator [Lichenibacterium minor]|uniref:histidine kinase n=1 Tax=Lichenibacterium minor TaxID=2316528 RepID=A0A4Q2U0N8_9HYPH|nr:response regulator [Lichenibacterium minor]RYC29983.1 response regulator [Lichenibacterium minor]
MSGSDGDVFHGTDAMAGRMRAFDWARTPLGKPESWPAPLRTLVGVMLGSKQPMFTVWGPALTLLHNAPYLAILGHKERDALGRSFLDVWGEIRAELAPLVSRALSGESVHMDDITLMVDRDGRDPEAHFSFSYTPVRDGGAVRGFFCACSETTDVVMAGRRQAFRLELEETLRALDGAEAIIDAAVTALGRHLGVSRVGYGEMGDDGVKLAVTSRYADGVAPIDDTYDLDVFGEGTAEALRSGRTVVVSDVREDPGSDPSAFGPLETLSLVTVPIMRAGRLSATLFVNQAEPRRWSDADVALIEGVAGRVGDAVERARAEAALRDSEAHLSGIFQQTGAGFAEVDADGRFLSVNGRFCAMAGRRPEELLRLRMRDITVAEDRAVSEAALKTAACAGEPATVEKRLLRPDGTTLWVANTKSAIAPVAGRRTVLVVAIDIAERKVAEQALADAKSAAEEANLAKSTFIANMSHELRTPLSAIIGYSEMMAEEIADGCDGSELAADMAKVEGNARHLLGLINDVLDLSKVESGKMEVYAEDFDVEPTLRDLVATVETLVAKKNNRLVLDLQPGLGRMRSDMTKLRQVLLNLLSNAAKFTDGGTITLSASRTPGRDGTDRLSFAVSDTGIGMTGDQLAKLFQRFTQADTSTTRRFGGTGLGLSLAKAFADMLGGDVAATSVEGQGSRFTFTLPASHAAAADLEGQPDADGALAEIAPGDLVLVIDDDEDQRTLMTRFLHREGFRVQVAADGRKGLQLARSLHPRAILLDVMMPGIDGWSVLSEIKADPNLATTPVVMVTSVDQRSLAASLGAADYMLKPVKWDRFSGMMDRFRTPSGGILLVEDQPDARAAVRGMLEDGGWVVTEAWDGRDGLRQAAAHPPEVVLLDLTMPVMDGFDFLDGFRKLPGCAEVPVVVLTARDLNRDERGRLRGANQILQKGDLSLRALVGRLEDLAARARAGEA